MKVMNETEDSNDMKFAQKDGGVEGVVPDKISHRSVASKDRALANALELNLADELDQAVGFWLRRAVSVADTLFAEVFSALNITTQHYAIIMSIRSNPECQSSALSALLNITPNNLVPHIDGLVSRGYVRRVEGSKDRRVKHLRLTPEGEAFAELLAEKHEEIRARIRARLGAKEQVKLLQLLQSYCG